MPRRFDRQTVVKWFALFTLALIVASGVSLALALPDLLPILSRDVRRGMGEALLSGAIILRTGLVLVSVVGLPLAAWSALVSRGRGRPAGWAGRAFLMGLSCLSSLIALELGAAIVLAWIHRFPVLPMTFPAEDPGVYRILVLGESSALGEPYRGTVSIGKIVAWKLAEAAPKRRFELETLAWLGDSLELQHQKLARIVRKPDAVVVYSGHNEFAARFESDRVYEVGMESTSAFVAGVHRLDAGSPFGRLVRELLSKIRLDSPPSLRNRHQVVDPPLCGPAESAAVLADFSARLEAIVAYCERIGAQPILVTSPANEADYEPSRSTVEPGVAGEERRRISDAMLEARSREASEPVHAEGVYRSIIDRHPVFAEAHYRLGGRMRAEGRVDEAREEFSKALDLDGLPIRCPSPFREVYRTVAERHPNCILIDGRRELMAASPTGMLDDSVVEDTHHPNLRGYVALSAVVLRELLKRADLGAEEFSRPDVSSTVAHFGLNSSRLAEACDRTSVHYRRVAGYRYDPTERLAKSERFAEAARRLRAGEPIDAVGLPAFPPEGRSQ